MRIYDIALFSSVGSCASRVAASSAPDDTDESSPMTTRAMLTDDSVSSERRRSSSLQVVPPKLNVVICSVAATVDRSACSSLLPNSSQESPDIEKATIATYREDDGRDVGGKDWPGVGRGEGSGRDWLGVGPGNGTLDGRVVARLRAQMEDDVAEVVQIVASLLLCFSI